MNRANLSDKAGMLIHDDLPPSVGDSVVTIGLTNGRSRESFDPIVEPLFWLLNSQTFDSLSATNISSWSKRIKKLKKKKRKEDQQSTNSSLADDWKDLLMAFSLEDFQVEPDTSPVRQVLACLGGAYLLPELVTVVEEEDAFLVLEPLIAEAGQHRLPNSNSMIQPWEEQLLGVELPLLLVTQFPELVVGDDWCEPAIEWMSGVIEEKLDSDGWPTAALLPIFGPMVASWTRCYFMLSRLNWEFDEAVLEQLQGSVRQLLRLLRADGQLMFTDPTSFPLTERCLKQLLKLSVNADDRKLAQRFLGDTKNKKAEKKWPSVQPGTVSEWGESAILRASWKRESARVGLDFSGNTSRCEIGARETLVFGNSFPTICFNGHAVAPESPFTVVSEERDEDLDYLELQMELTSGFTLNRQWLLARKEQILFVADALISGECGRIEYECDWPLADGISIMPETETREVYLMTNKIQSLVLPLSLPEWQVGASLGKLEFNSELNSSNSLKLTDQNEGTAIYVPLVFDLCPKRAKQKRTWRQLTVAESRMPVSRDVAAAFRFQIGKEQWFVYRALSSKGIRTFFGEHFSGEFVFGRFKKNGEIESLVRID